tara:strand:- start:2197 stop:3162 length:966 start_codon:yes stop_codon:yes gene_type:complete
MYAQQRETDLADPFFPLFFQAGVGDVFGFMRRSLSRVYETAQELGLPVYVLYTREDNDLDHRRSNSITDLIMYDGRVDKVIQCWGVGEDALRDQYPTPVPMPEPCAFRESRTTVAKKYDHYKAEVEEWADGVPFVSIYAFSGSGRPGTFTSTRFYFDLGKHLIERGVKVAFIGAWDLDVQCDAFGARVVNATVEALTQQFGDFCTQFYTRPSIAQSTAVIQLASGRVSEASFPMLLSQTAPYNGHYFANGSASIEGDVDKELAAILPMEDEQFVMDNRCRYLYPDAMNPMVMQGMAERCAEDLVANLKQGDEEMIWVSEVA